MAREERDNYRGDVWYDEWRRGMPEGSLSDDRIDDGYDSGQSAESLVSQEARQQEDARLERRRAEEYEEWLRGQERLEAQEDDRDDDQ